jgi:hypothetical protein
MSSGRKEGTRFLKSVQVEIVGSIMVIAFVLLLMAQLQKSASGYPPPQAASGNDQLISSNAQEMLGQGKRIFRFDTFGDEDFWGERFIFIRRLLVKNWAVSVPE